MGGEIGIGSAFSVDWVTWHALRHALGQNPRFWWQEGGFLLTLDQLVEVQILVPQFINAVFETKIPVTVRMRPYACNISPDRRHA